MNRRRRATGYFPAIARTARVDCFFFAPCNAELRSGIFLVFHFHSFIPSITMRFPAFTSLLLLGAALPALAQTSPDTPATPRFYVGLAYSGGTAHYPENTLYLNANTGPNTSYYTVDGDYTRRQASVSALARYTLTANPAHRLQFDALGGLTLERASSYSRGTQTNYAAGSAATTSDYSFNHAQNTILLTGGVGARYRLSRHFELTYDFTVNKALNNRNNVYGNAITGTNTLTTSQALGLRYRFGR